MSKYEVYGLRTIKKSKYNKEIDKTPVTRRTYIDFAIVNVSKFLGVEAPFVNTVIYSNMILDYKVITQMEEMLPRVMNILDHAKRYIELHTRKPKKLLDLSSEDFNKYFNAAIFGTPYSYSKPDDNERTMIVELLEQLIHQMAYLELVRVKGKYVQVSTNKDMLYHALSEKLDKHTARNIAGEFSSRHQLGGTRRRSRRSRRRSSRRRSRR
jgi:hypothetical protein